MSNAAAARDNTFTSRTGDINALQRENGSASCGCAQLRRASHRMHLIRRHVPVNAAHAATSNAPATHELISL